MGHKPDVLPKVKQAIDDASEEITKEYTKAMHDAGPIWGPMEPEEFQRKVKAIITKYSYGD